jgi:hypothetical protein
MAMENAFALYANVQLYFTDSNYVTLDSLIVPSHDILGEAPVDASGKVIGSKRVESTFDMDRMRYQKIGRRTHYAIVKGLLKTSGTGSIKINSSNSLRVQLAARAKFRIKNLSK